MKELYFYEQVDGKIRLYKVSLKQRWRVWKDHPNAISISKIQYDALMDKYNDERLAKEKKIKEAVELAEHFDSKAKTWKTWCSILPTSRISLWQRVKRFFGKNSYSRE